MPHGELGHGELRLPGAPKPKEPSKTGSPSTDEQGLSEEDRKAVEELKARDREVRAHEQAHMAAAGGHALGGPSYSYQTGPDGKRYAIGGEVKIDTSPVRDDPRATIAKAQAIRAAALAPADPSGADRAVAAAASKMEADAQRELAEKSDPSMGKTDASAAHGRTDDPEKANGSAVAGEYARNKPGASASNGPALELFA